MQDTAKQAWRASRQFASSVITGGVSISACRQCTSKRNSSNASARQPPAQVQQECSSGVCIEQDQQQHTSVIEVVANSAESSNAAQDEQKSESTTKPSPSNLIRVDHNNKLTIVTKFNDSGESQVSQADPISLADTSNGSERSRCESSSSGRGSETCSAGSQNGEDSADHSMAAAHISPDRKSLSHSNQPLTNDKSATGGQSSDASSSKRHRRKSSIFKAAKVLGGSQLSLNKLKSLFTPAKSISCSPVDTVQASSEQQQDVMRSFQHLESSRLRCMELNQALKVVAPESLDKISSSQIGQGDREEDDSMKKENSATLQCLQSPTSQPDANHNTVLLA